MASNVIRIVCPNLKCRAILSAPSEARGKSVRCGQCGMLVKIPMAEVRPKPAAGAGAA